MASWNGSRDVTGHREHSGSTSRPPLPRPDNGDNHRPVPLWEREFCRNAYGIPWETFCESKRFITLYKNVMDWDDSGALKSFEDAKEMFRAQYYGEPFEDPLLDPDMYIDEVRGAHPYSTPNNRNSNFHGSGPSRNWQQQEVVPGQTSSGTGRKLIGGGTMWISGASSGGATKWTGGGGNGSGRNGNGGSGSGSGGGNGGNGSGGGGAGRNWNCFGVGSGSGRNWSGGGNNKGMNQDEGQHQQRNLGGMQRNPDEGRHHMRSGGRQQQGQGFRKMEWRPVPHKRAPPKDDPAA